MTGQRVAVVGAGAVGTTVAADLAAAGAEVALFDRGTVAGGATGRAAGICYDAFAEDVDARVADRAMERFRSVAADGEFALTDCPYVVLAREGDDRRIEAIRESVERMRVNDRDVRLLGPGEAAAEFPTLWTDDVAVAAVARDAAHVDPGTYPPVMAERARRAGAEVHEHCPVVVRADSTDAGGESTPGIVAPEVEFDADAVVVAAGAHTPALLADAGIQIPVKPYRVQALTATLGSSGYDAPIVYDATAGFYARPHPAGLLAGDGTEQRRADPDEYDQSGDDDFEASTLAGVRERLRVTPTLERSWAGLCTATPDRDPLVGQVAPGLYVATGFQGHGFMRSPAVGEALAEAVLAGERAPIDPFDPGRFEGDEEFEIREGMLVDE